ncbi:MAG: N-6 DNA methylase [Verrucomicrobiaceae bacterium]|nr:N-6 DNA methylase [Verrucomicrobiaceae bacterium]
MSKRTLWLADYTNGIAVDGLVPVMGFNPAAQQPETVAVMEKAKHYGADAVFFEASQEGKPPIAQAFVYRSDGPVKDPEFAQRHKELWSWGGVPLLYRVTSGVVQLFRCAHKPDFEQGAEIVCKPFKTLKLATQIASDPWWDAERLRNGTLWDDPAVCKKLLSSKLAAQKTLINAVRELHEELNAEGILPKPLRRKLLILSVLVAYLEARQVFEDDFFGRFKKGASKFFQVLADGPALVALLEALEERFNGHVFTLSRDDSETLRTSRQLPRFARLIEGRQEAGGQLTLWQRYSFADLPVELISHIYQLFVKDSSVAVYTPHFMVRMMLGEVLSWDRLDRLEKNNEVILDGACGSGIFLVEAYKRLVLHWRSRNNWDRPKQMVLKRLLTSRIRGVDLEEGAVELASFSLCLAVCDALEPMEIRASVKLFPELKEKFIHTGCFFETLEAGTIKDKVGVIVGNPPFASKLGTEGAKRAYESYQKEHGELPDKQVAYLFLHKSMELLAPGGVLSMLQQYNFLYNQQSLGFRRKFIQRWDVREILDFISVRGLFQKGDADTKVIVVVAEAQDAPLDRHILHATFRRSGRTDAEQGFDIDYYDMHWLTRDLVMSNDGVWRCNLLGGGRTLGFVDRLRKLPTIGQYASSFGWDCGEGFIVGKTGKRLPAEHLTGKPLLPSGAISGNSIDENVISVVTDKLFKTAYTKSRFSPPMLLVREQMDIDSAVWSKSYLTYKNKVVGICGAKAGDVTVLNDIQNWLNAESTSLRAYVAAISVRLFTQKATTLSEIDVLSLPLPESRDLKISPHERILISEIVSHYRDLIRLGEDSAAMKDAGLPALPAFNETFIARINAVYKKNKLQALPEQVWPGVICQPYVFGKGKVDWNNTNELKDKVDALLREKRGAGLKVTRIARVYDGPCIYLLKPDRLRYWLRSIALRDADETLADLAEQGF